VKEFMQDAPDPKSAFTTLTVISHILSILLIYTLTSKIQLGLWFIFLSNGGCYEKKN
jgi:hypothetical protein